MPKQHRAFSKIIREKERPLKVIYVSSYIPRMCGIATFTQDLTTAINNINTKSLAEILVIHREQDGDLSYPWESKFRIRDTHKEDYVAAAEYVNNSSVDVVNLQHEFGLYGGECGDYILEFVRHLKKPLVTNFHSVLPDPDAPKLRIMRELVKRSDATIVMTRRSRTLLNTLYGCDSSKSVVIYHGVPDFTFNETERHKKALEISAKPMIMVSGLLGPGKGYEFVIDAMPKIVENYPKAQLHIIGQTHPNVLVDGKDLYRQGLIDLTKKHGMEKHVVLVDKFLSIEELVAYYKAADFFITPHLEPQQPTSGTLSKALGAGNVCISTPYYYAKELLKENVGILVPFRNSEAISEAVIDVMKRPRYMHRLRKNAYKVGRLMVWPSVARQYLVLFRLVSDQ